MGLTSYSSRSGRGWARVAAALNVVCVRVVYEGAVAGSVPLVVAALGLAVACVLCVAGLWRAPGRGSGG
ncbi:hypothetical protein [Cryptosporangium arvum]|uniref:hypothetical protein n=1 Tax=Cryptosporangium arvum TaxID=80871 RepID=UPI0012EDA1DA|nr:hypothetical protein [Cryptosporangium arvum]